MKTTILSLLILSIFSVALPTMAVESETPCSHISEVDGDDAAVRTSVESEGEATSDDA